METLQIIWFFLILLFITVYAVLDGFDLGAGCWYPFADDAGRMDILKNIGPFWDGNEVWLLAVGGALFAAFPPVYAAVFSGFYIVIILLLSALIFRAVAIEFRNKINHPIWKSFWDIAFSAGSISSAIILGVAIGNLIRGVELDKGGNYTGGFFALFNPFALTIGVLLLSAFAMHGALFLSIKSSGSFLDKADRWAKIIWRLYFTLYIVSAYMILTIYQQGEAHISFIISIATLSAILMIRYYINNRKRSYAFLFSALSIVGGIAFLGSSIFPYLVPDVERMGNGLSLYNASSSELALKVMLIIAAIGMPVVMVYTIFFYRLFYKKKL